MDPINNLTSTPNPAPTPSPVPTPSPTPNPAPTPSPVPMPSLTPNPAPSPTLQPIPAPTPVTTPSPVNPVASPTGGFVASPYQSSPLEIPATDPIMKPEPIKGPDPIEEELRAPMRAAEPVPGSIGSAVSGPSSEGVDAGIPVSDNPFDNLPKERAQSVPFNDPAIEPNGANGGVVSSVPVEKPQNKKTLIALIVVAVAIVAVLIVILVMQLTSGNDTPVNNTPSPTPTPANDTPATTLSVLSCRREMTSEEILSSGKAITSGTIELSATFNEEKELQSVSLTKTGISKSDDEKASVEENKEETSKGEVVMIDEKEAEVEYLTSEVAGDFYLLDSEKKVMTELNTIEAHYEDLAFVCELL